MDLQTGSCSRNNFKGKGKSIMHENDIRSSAPGKLILLGEYAVLEQAPCLVSAVRRDCTVSVDQKEEDAWFSIKTSRNEVPDVECKLTEEGRFRVKGKLSEKGRKRLRFVLHTLKYVVQQYDYSGKGASVFINTNRFFHQPSQQKLGLGASAAITVALLDALTKFIGCRLTDNELYRQAFEIHRKAQGGLGSGMDIAASATGGVFKYQMKLNTEESGLIESVDWPKDLQMLSIWAGHSASTQNMVQEVKAFKKARPKRYRSVMKTMRTLSEEGCEAFKIGDTEAFLDIILDYRLQEKELGEASGADIISEVHQDIGDLVDKAGGSYKPSGAGGGDIGIAFCRDQETSFKIKQSIEKSQFDILDLPLQAGKPA